jgi:hypothetical protein
MAVGTTDGVYPDGWIALQRAFVALALADDVVRQPNDRVMVSFQHINTHGLVEHMEAVVYQQTGYRVRFVCVERNECIELVMRFL